jgi:rhodanese-related sulfurtransferase
MPGERRDGMGSAATPIGTITVREAWARLSDAPAHPAPALIDVRETWEYAEGRAQGAVSIPLSELRARYQEVPRDRDVFFICHSGQRSYAAARFLARQGVTRVHNVEGGTEEWEAAALPMDRPTADARG